MTRARIAGLWPLCIAATMVSAAAHATATSCPVVDVMPEYRQVLDRSARESLAEQATALEKDFVMAHAALYRPEVLGLDDPNALSARIRKSLPDLRQRADSIGATADTLRAQLPGDIADFRAAFPDFDCSFTIYLMPTFGMLDGAGRVVTGKPALVFGVDTIAANETPAQLKVFVDHELFHRYHFQVAGFSDADNSHAVIWRALWTEGLATYVSATLNPKRPLAEALILPLDLETRAKARLRTLSATLRANLDRVAPDVFNTYFSYGDRAAAEAGLPWRGGYYVGYRVAKRLGESRSLVALAHLQGAALRAQIAAVLDELAANPLVSNYPGPIQ
jgi:hypothetical protein